MQTRVGHKPTARNCVWRYNDIAVRVLQRRGQDNWYWLKRHQSHSVFDVFNALTTTVKTTMLGPPMRSFADRVPRHSQIP